MTLTEGESQKVAFYTKNAAILSDFLTLSLGQRLSAESPEHCPE